MNAGVLLLVQCLEHDTYEYIPAETLRDSVLTVR